MTFLDTVLTIIGTLIVIAVVGGALMRLLNALNSDI